MSIDPHVSGLKPPVVLGASGRIGHGFQRLAQAGLWPGTAPLWQARPGSGLLSTDRLDWDILQADVPDIGPCQGVICLAGVVSGDLALNTDLALAAIELARISGNVPVLLTSSAAVYGPSDGFLAEEAACNPATDYGRAKLQMEQAVAARVRDLGQSAPPVCILRIGNVAGADALLLAAARGAVNLDRFSDANGPERSYIGMLDLAQVMTRLIRLSSGANRLPPILNIASARPVQMAALLNSAGVPWGWRQASVLAQRRLLLDTARLGALLSPHPISDDPDEIIRQSGLAGWVPA